MLRSPSLKVARWSSSWTRCGTIQKKLSRQSWLAELVLDRAQEGLRVATEAAAQDAGSTPLLEAVADLAPPAPLGRGEVARLATAEPGERRRDEPHRAAQHQAGRGR